MFEIGSLISGLFGLGKSYIDDKEKLAEFNNDVLKIGLQMQEHILTMQTTPKMDALVKFMYAFKEMVIPLMRPIVSAALSGFAAFASYKHIDLGSVGIVMGSAFPGWMASRGIEKLTDKT